MSPHSSAVSEWNPKWSFFFYFNRRVGVESRDEFFKFDEIQNWFALYFTRKYRQDEILE